MSNHNLKTKSFIFERILSLIVFISLLLAANMFIPVFVALAVGVSNLSILIFSFFTFIAVFLLITTLHNKYRYLAVIGLIVSLLSLIVPQVNFFTSAKSNNFELSFDPKLYITFSGTTDIKPSSIQNYKAIGKQKLSMAHYKTKAQDQSKVVVLLHGGAWRYGSYLETGHWPETLTKAGYTVFSIQYRLSNSSYHSWRDTPQDVHDAIKYIKSNSNTFNIDGNDIHLLGQSAGGHLALLEAYRFEEVKSVIALYAPIDLILDYNTSRDKTAELDFIGGPPKQFKERYDSLSPISYINGSEPSTLLIQGIYDDLVHPSQSTNLSNRLTASGINNEILLLPYTGHSFENQRGGFANQIATQKVLEFLK